MIDHVNNSENGAGARTKINQTIDAVQCASDITVSLPPGEKIGPYANGEVIPSQGKTLEQILNLLAVKDLAPTYTIPTMVLTKSATTQAEVGTAYSNDLTATYTANDAGAVTMMKIQKNGVDMTPNGSASPFIKTDTGSYVLGNISYTAYSNYNAGTAKTYTPSGNTDARTPLVRNVNAPQAAGTLFGSNTVVLTGTYKVFYGDSASAPNNSATTRALPSNRFTDAGNTFILNTGTSNKIFTVAIPATMSLVSVIDLDALNANITANYILSTFNVNDAGGNAVSYKVYTITNAVVYPSNHQHQITIS